MGLNRREFLQAVSTLAGSFVVTALNRCAPGSRGGAAPNRDTSASSAKLPSTQTIPPPTTVAPPSATPETPKQLMNENREGWYIRYSKIIEPVDPQTWRLSVDGLVEHPQQLTFEDIRSFPVVHQRSRMKCVEGWSVAAEWMGFLPQILVDVVKPKPEASWVHFHCADDYFESLPMSEFLMDRVLFAYGANGDLLRPEYGLPLRLIVPHKYGYKGPKVLTRISFTDEEMVGFWPALGAYSAQGDIVAGVDRPLDLDITYQVHEKPGEIFYEEGLESEE